MPTCPASGRRLNRHPFCRTPVVDESERLAWCRRQLTEAAQLLAVGPEGHAAALHNFVHVPDELRLVWADAYALAAQVRDAGLVSAEAARLAASVDDAVKAAPVLRDYDTALRAIAEAPEWATVRDRARELVRALGAEAEPPSLQGSYVK